MDFSSIYGVQMAETQWKKPEFPPKVAPKRVLVAFFHPETDKLELGWTRWNGENFGPIHYMNGPVVCGPEHILFYHELPKLPSVKRNIDERATRIGENPNRSVPVRD